MASSKGRRKSKPDSAPAPPEAQASAPAATHEPAPALPPVEPESAHAPDSYWARRTRRASAAPNAPTQPPASPTPPTTPAAPTGATDPGDEPTAPMAIRPRQEAPPGRRPFSVPVVTETPPSAAASPPGAPTTSVPTPRDPGTGGRSSSYWSKLSERRQETAFDPAAPPPVESSPETSDDAPGADGTAVAELAEPAEQAETAEQAEPAETAETAETAEVAETAETAEVAEVAEPAEPAPVRPQRPGRARARRDAQELERKEAERARREDVAAAAPAVAEAVPAGTTAAVVEGADPATATLTVERPGDPSPAATAPAHRRHRRRRRWPHRALMATGSLLIIVAAAWQIRATLWTTHSERVGHALVQHFRSEEGALPAGSGAAGGSLGACSAATDTDPVKGLLLIPKLGVTAPVEDGVGDDQLNVAVGHLPSSVWPGTTGNSVLEAHDVSYFVNLSQLEVGDSVQFQSPCTDYLFRVSAHNVVQQGSPVDNTTTPTLTMVTCWPTNALWFTPQRYLVTATLVSSTPRRGPTQSYVAASPAPTVAVPSELAAQGVTLTTYSVPMGTLSITGTPDQTWTQSTNPLLVQDSAVEAYIAGVRALTENRPDWWSSFAPTAPIPPALVGASVAYKSSLDVSLEVTGSTPTGVVLTVTAAVTGGSAPGTYAMTVDEAISAGQLTITNWILRPA